MSSAIYPDPPRLVTAVCGHGEQQRLSNARLRLTFLLFPGYSLARARVGRFRISRRLRRLCVRKTDRPAHRAHRPYPCENGIGQELAARREVASAAQARLGED